jgi:hypothetical protein
MKVRIPQMMTRRNGGQHLARWRVKDANNAQELPIMMLVQMPHPHCATVNHQAQMQMMKTLMWEKRPSKFHLLRKTTFSQGPLK